MTTLSNKNEDKPTQKVYESLLARNKKNEFTQVISTLGLAELYKSNSTKDTILRDSVGGSKKELAIIPTNSKSNTRIIVKDVGEDFKTMPVHTKQTLSVLMKILWETKQPSIVIPLKEFMERRGLTNETRARKEIAEDLSILQRTTIAFDLIDRNGKHIDTIDVSILDAKGRIQSSNIFAGISLRLYSALLAGLERKDGSVFLIQTSDVTDRMNFSQSPLAFTLSVLINEYLSRNMYDKHNDYEKKEYFIMSIRNILRKCKELKSKEEVIQEAERKTQETGKKVKPRLNQFIIAPVENALNKLMNGGMFSDWTYCHAKGVPLNDEEWGIYDEDITEESFEPVKKDKYYANYDVWESLYIKIPFPINYPREDHDKTKTVKYREEKKAKKRNSKK